MVVSTEMVSLEKSILTMPVSEEKVGLLTGNYDLAVNKVFQWYSDRHDYIAAKGAPARDDVYNGEKEEYEEAKNSLWGRILSERDLSIPWYDDPLADDIWTVASEGADVTIVGLSELQHQGYDVDFAAKLLRGDFAIGELEGWVAEFQGDIREIQNDLGCIGVDLAEAILLKSSINEQHYPSAFLPWVMIDKIGRDGDMQTFARRLRAGVGKTDSSQMPDLSMTWMGESTLSRAQGSPFGSNGYSPTAIYVREHGEVEVAPSDKDHTYDGLYVIGGLKWLFDDGEHRFHHEAKRADYRWYFSRPEWKSTLSSLKSLGLDEIVVPSGSGFRYAALEALSKYVELGFEHVGQVDDEIQWTQYLKWCGLRNEKPNIFVYQQHVAEGKHARLDLLHDRHDQKGSHKGIVAAMDEIIMWWDENSQEYVPIEKPGSEAEVTDQILKLVSGKQFLVSNATAIGPLQRNGAGGGLSTHLIPMRIECKDDDERISLAGKWLEAYRNAAKGIGRWKVTPGGVSMLHDVLQPHQMVTIYKDLSSMILPFGDTSNHKKFIDEILAGGVELPYLKLPEKMQNEIGIAIGGLSLVGLKSAIERYVMTRSWYGDAQMDHRRERRLAELAYMMTL